MKLKQLNEHIKLYGYLSVLDNRLQACENGAFPDMTMKQHFMLEALKLFENAYPTLKEMGDLIGCSYQNVKRLAIQLEKKGYLRLITDEKDLRKVRLVPNEKLEELSSEKHQATTQFMKQLFSNISNEDICITLKTIQQMIANISELA